LSAAETEIEIVRRERTDAFRETHERDALSTAWSFRVVWHEQTHELAATRAGDIVGVLGLRIAASLAHVDSLFVATDVRREGIGRALLARAEQLANYYNAHKVTLEAPAHSDAEKFFSACGYKIEAVLPQHTWKLDVAIMRKFLL
jgi:N-acetylglutamate synthase-like GNAT family acetyltransferase